MNKQKYKDTSKNFTVKQKDLNTRISQYEKDNVNEKYIN